MPRRRRESGGCAAALRQRQGRHRTAIIALLANKVQARAGCISGRAVFPLDAQMRVSVLPPQLNERHVILQ